MEGVSAGWVSSTPTRRHPRHAKQSCQRPPSLLARYQPSTIPLRLLGPSGNLRLASCSARVRSQWRYQVQLGNERELAGEMRVTREARVLWNELQDRNREEIRGIIQFDSTAEAYGSALAEETSKILKLAMIFEACRWAANPARNPREIQRDTLQLAAEHGRYCLAAGRALDAIGRRGEIRDEANAILANIRTEWKASAKHGTIEATRTQLTHRFASNPNRRGALTPARLYSEILPDLIQRRQARLARKEGRLEVYQFPVE